MPTARLTPALLVALSLCSPVLAQPSTKGRQPAARTGQPASRRSAPVVQPTGAAGNAALTYYGVWATLGETDMKSLNELCPETSFGQPLSTELHQLLVRHEGEIKRILRATAVKDCDFGLDFDDGFMMLMPHLSKLRTTARMLRSDAHRCIVEGKLDDAADRYAAILGLARHAASDRVMISSLVGIAIAAMPATDLVDAKGAAMLTPAGRAKVLAAIDRFGGAEGFRLKEAILGERQMAVEAAITKFDGPDAGRRMEEELHLVDGLKSDTGGGNAAQQRSIERVRAMDGEALRAELSKLNPFYTEAVAAWDKPNVNEELKRLTDAAGRGEFGEFGYHFLPALVRCHVSQEKGKESLDKIAEALRKADADAAMDAKAVR